MIRLWLCFCIALCGGCLVPQSAFQLAGFTEPAFEMKTPTGWKVRVPTDADGSVKYSLAPDGTMNFEMDLSSDASTVTGSQGERAAILTELRAIEAQRIVEQHRMLTDTIKGVLDLVSPLLRPVPAPTADPP